MTAVVGVTFGSDVTAGYDLIPNLTLPTDAAAYLGLPSNSFRTAMSFNDGDVYGLEGGPYQNGESYLQYAITNVTVTAVPEPANILPVGTLPIFLCRRVDISSIRFVGRAIIRPI